MTAFPTLLFPLTFLIALAIEPFVAVRPQPRVRWWRLRGLVLFALAGVINTAVPALVRPLIPGVLPLAEAPLVPAVVVAIAVTDLAAYWLHRAKHAVPALWRWTHQMHHSAERVDVAGTAFAHPFDHVANALAGALVATLLGVSPLAAAITSYAIFVLGIFQHSGMATPVWLGWLVQRPEAHSVHHAHEIHAHNYGNLALWDLAFGTHANPPEHHPRAGFGKPVSVGAMLAGRDVTSDARERTSSPLRPT